MIKLFFLTICAFYFSISVEACVTPFRKINLSNTSLEKNPISVRGSSIYFDKGTADEVLFRYNQELKKWCIEKELPEKSDCNLNRSNHLTNSKNEIYADLEITGNKLKVYAVNKEKGFSRTKSFIEFKDISKKEMEAVTITSSSGSNITVSYRPGMRGGIQEKSLEKETLDLSKSISGMLGCGGQIHTNSTGSK